MPVTTTALLLEAPDRLRFVVDEVPPAAAPCETEPTEALWVQALESPPLAWSERGPLVPAPGPALLRAVARAFNEHRNLVLSPDALWLTIAQGISRHVNETAEVSQKQAIRVGVSELPATEADWQSLFGDFAQEVRARHPQLGVRLRCDFSTSDAVDRAVGDVTLMSTFKRYFDYIAVAICGIPEVELRGTVADWQALRRRLDVLEGLGLGWWAEALTPVVDQLVDARRGRPDRDFWRRIYKERDRYGGHDFNGWIGLFYPYQGEEGRLRNPMIEAPGCFLDPGALPTSLVSADIVLQLGDEGGRVVTAFAGLLGLRQEGLDLEPVSGWAVSEPTPLGLLLHQLSSRFTRPALHVGLKQLSHRRPMGMGVDLQVLLAHLGGGRLGALELRAPALLGTLEWFDDLEVYIPEVPLFAALDGVQLGYLRREEGGFEIVAWDPARPQELQVVARSLVQWLAALVEAEDPADTLQAVETLPIPAGAEVTAPAPGEYWDARPEDWQIARVRVFHGDIYVRCAALKPRQIGVLRSMNAALRATPLRQLVQELPRVERYHLAGVGTQEALEDLSARLREADIPFEVEGEGFTRTRAVHRPTNLQPWLSEEVLDAMIAAGVEVVER